MLLRAIGLAMLFILPVWSTPAHALVIFAGVPFEGPLPTTVPSLPAGAFLVPVQATGAASLQTWQFDLEFNAGVVQAVDPFDGSSGIYGALFDSSDSTSASFILGGFAFNDLGLVDDVAGSYPALLDGVTGDGVLAYVVFAFLAGHETEDPGIQVVGQPSQPVPEPSTLFLTGLGLVGVPLVRRKAASKARQKLGTFGLVGMLALGVAGPAAEAAEGVGPYYATPSWDLTLPASTRFVVLTNFGSQAVLDRETGLVWQRTPNSGVGRIWTDAGTGCNRLIVAGRMGWRLPSLAELSSLVEVGSDGAGYLPAGHPFEGIVQGDFRVGYWSSTPYRVQPADAAWFVTFAVRGATIARPAGFDNQFPVWCVRTGSGSQPQ